MNMRNETDEFGRREESCENIFGNETDKDGNVAGNSKTPVYRFGVCVSKR